MPVIKNIAAKKVTGAENSRFYREIAQKTIRSNKQQGATRKFLPVALFPYLLIFNLLETSSTIIVMI